MQSDATIVAVPSMSIPYFGSPLGESLVDYEERILYLLHLLKDPRKRLIVVTSRPVAEALVSYLLQLLPGVPYSHARRRLHLLSVLDDSEKPLTLKILERPLLLARIRLLLKGEWHGFLSCYTVTELEEKLGHELGLRVYGPRSEHLKLATKSVARNIFSDLQIAVADGYEHLASLNDIAAAIVRLARAKPTLQRAIIKHNYSIAGLGNAGLELGPVRALLEELSADSLTEEEIACEVATRLPDWVVLGHRNRSWQSYLTRFCEGGGAVEEFIKGEPCSVKVRIGQHQEVDVIATHDELSQGVDGQVYLACRMPARPELAGELARLGKLVGERLAELGVLGRFDVDCLASPSGATEVAKLYALDINLRKGNTTLPIRTLQLLTGGAYDADEGVFRGEASSKEELCYLSTDHFGAGQLYGLLPRDLIEIVSMMGLHYSSATGSGALFHMLGSMSERGRVGITCLGHSYEELDETYDTVLDGIIAEKDGYRWIT